MISKQYYHYDFTNKIGSVEGRAGVYGGLGVKAVNFILEVTDQEQERKNQVLCEMDF